MPVIYCTENFMEGKLKDEVTGLGLIELFLANMKKRMNVQYLKIR
ncbi:unnamed protein product [Moneuplotes crassus]|uniref:Uncharacterized protein n=1 Tax=Euplotes crassus TaxID=5936 RepID=A0AAD2D4B6_EUPCR|nr:unnamed protein product [Moneuplotes crassus]